MIQITRRAVALSLAAVSLLALRTRHEAFQAPAAGMLLLDATLSRAELPATIATMVDGAQRLDAELVSQWRRGLSAALRSRGGKVTAIVRWDKALILSGLAREERCRVTTARLSQSVFQVEFAV